MRTNLTPSLVGTSNSAKIDTAIEAARQRSRIRKHSPEELASPSKASDPGNLERNKNWITWSRELKNYLSTILGQDIIPLRYVIRESDASD